MSVTGMWGHGRVVAFAVNAWLMVELGDVKGLFQPKQINDSLWTPGGVGSQ